MNDKLRELLNRQKASGEVAAKDIDWDSRRKAWLASIDELHREISAWFREAGGLAPEREEIQRSEPYVGAYLAPVLKLNVIADRIYFEPVAMRVLSAKGRIDAYAVSKPQERISLVLKSDGKWNVSMKSPKPHLVPFDRDQFVELLEQLLRR